MLNSIKNALKHNAQLLQDYSSSPRLDAELLLAFVCKNSRAWLYAYDDQQLTDAQQILLEALINRRILGEPIAYLVGQKEFWNLTLAVNASVLIPRPETEHLIEWILQRFSKETHQSVLDLGTGSGALALVLASERPAWTIDAVDISEEALVVAKSNAKTYQLTQVKFYLGDWYAALPPKRYSLIVSNPPYVADLDPHLSQLKFEPQLALSSGKTGLKAIEAIIEQASDFLIPGGEIVIEHGYNQSEEVRQIFIEHRFIDIVSHMDLAVLPRFMSAVRHQNS